MEHSIKYLIVFFLIYTTLLRAQVKEDDIKKILILQNTKEDELEARTELLYRAFMQKVSYNWNDLLEGAMYSSLSGISLGAYESNMFGYKNSEWLPGPLQKWYDARSNYKADYNILSWQTFFREADLAADRTAYLKLLRFFNNQWVFAFLGNWLVKNTMATIVRDQFRFGKPFYSFQLNLIF